MKIQIKSGVHHGMEIAFVAVERSSVFVCYNVCEASVRCEMPARNEMSTEKCSYYAMCRMKTTKMI